MAIEIEVKMKVADHDAVRSRLHDLQARRIGEVLETNTFFDMPGRALLAEDRGLRLRTNVDVATKHASHIVTYKGPRAAGAVKKREEIEVGVHDAEATARLFEALGYRVTLSFEKQRETWQWNNCSIELDELPLLGKYVEIEGSSEEVVLSVRAKLGLEKVETITEPYIGLLEAELVRADAASRRVRF